MKLQKPQVFDLKNISETIDGIEDILAIESMQEGVVYALGDKEMVIITSASGYVRMPTKKAKAVAQEILDICEVFRC